ncbi:putative periplasmic lipoprotein [Archangium violaceum]|uniref:hypothetical protein n=1 Tax=Archangium violaceum TaxID=83451 RepID=UPI0036DCD7C8
MKRLMTIAALALGQAACVANQGDAPFRFLDARALTFEEGVGCVPSDELVLGSGSLDLSGSGNYLMAMSVETNNSTQPITINQEQFSGPGLNDITVSEFVYSYQFQPITAGVTVALPADEEDRVALYRVLRPGTNADQSYVFMNAFGPKMVEVLRSFPVGSVGTVFATIKARGRLSGGQTVESNKFTFPITVSASGASSCPPGQIPAGACQILGQDGSGCVDPT